MRLRRKVVHLVGLDSAEQSDQAGTVGQVTVVQEQPRTRFVRVDIKVIDPRGVERRRPADQSVDFLHPLANNSSARYEPS